MAMNSSFLPRLSFSRGDRSLLPLHEPASPPIHLADLSPRPDDVLPTDRPSASRRSSSSHRNRSPSGAFSDKASATGSASKLKPRALFAGPPPPIAISRLLYRDEEDATPRPGQPSDLGGSTSLSRSAFSGVFHERVSPTQSREQRRSYEADTAWRNLRRREGALQKELQDLLDIQSLGLTASLDPTASQQHLHLARSAEGTSALSSIPVIASSTPHRPRVAFEPPDATASGEVVPVRQPRQKPMGLRGARAGLSRSMALLADLKAEEDANLTSALSIRKRALAELRRLSAQKAGITEELRGLESNHEEPLANELRELGEEQAAVSTEITELEERLVGLRTRKRWLTGRIEDVRNRREAGLSGYRGALKDVDGRVSAILRRPPINPLDLEAIGIPGNSHSEGTAASVALDRVDQSPGGVEFLRMRPERRTADMAKDWWESEVRILEGRKSEVDKDRSALEEGGEVWKQTMKLVSDFERGLREEISRHPQSDGDGESKASVNSPERAMHSQLGKMAEVVAGLEEHLRKAENEGWNLLICAIGAELEAFREAEEMLREALGATFLDEDNTMTPPVARSGGGIGSGSIFHPPDPSTSKQLLGMHADKAVQDNTEVPTGLQPSETREGSRPTTSEHETSGDDNENEVPPEFLAEHRRDDDDDVE
ncbi:hypothetical protein GQ53DRAFT_836253 [Thozetella sp. PMI_491]|nr:hypothetical protein GQ53DRAFT_836253 [Thozetella sp. PMI_491]